MFPTSAAPPRPQEDFGLDAATTTRFRNIEDELKSLFEEVANLQSEVANFQPEVANLQSEIEILQARNDRHDSAFRPYQSSSPGEKLKEKSVEHIRLGD